MAIRFRPRRVIQYDAEGHFVRRSAASMALAALADLASPPARRMLLARGMPSALAWGRTGNSIRRAMARVRVQG